MLCIGLCTGYSIKWTHAFVFVLFNGSCLFMFLSFKEILPKLTLSFRLPPASTSVTPRTPVSVRNQFTTYGQSVQNAAALLLTASEKRNVTILYHPCCSCGFLLVLELIFKLFSFVCWPSLMFFDPYELDADWMLLAIPRSSQKLKETRPLLWNSLPEETRLTKSFPSFISFLSDPVSQI